MKTETTERKIDANVTTDNIIINDDSVQPSIETQHKSIVSNLICVILGALMFICMFVSLLIFGEKSSVFILLVVIGIFIYANHRAKQVPENEQADSIDIFSDKSLEPGLAANFMYMCVIIVSCVLKYIVPLFLFDQWECFKEPLLQIAEIFMDGVVVGLIYTQISYSKITITRFHKLIDFVNKFRSQLASK